LRKQAQFEVRPPSFWPQWLVELKRKHLELQRMLN